MQNKTIIKRQPSVQDARNTLRAKGWTQAAAARHLGVSAIHLCYVLNGHRVSKRILRAIASMPPNPKPA